MTAARDTLQAMRPIVVSDALASDLRAGRLEAYVRRETADIRRAAVLSEQAQAVYDRVLAATCQQVVESVVALPGFSVHLQVAAFQDVRELRRTIDRLADGGGGRDGGARDGGPPGPKALPAADPAKVFERRYLAHVEASLGQLELFLQDLSPLASTGVSALGLHLLTAADLSSLAGTGIRSLSIRDLRLDRGLHPLPDELPLEELVLDYLPRSRDLTGIERWPTLARLTIRGIARPDEHAALAELPALDSLTIRSPEAEIEVT